MARERKFSKEDLYRETKYILLQHGYEGFTIQMLAAKLDVSRGAIYKYYDNKDVLITDYMIYETEQFVERLKIIHLIDDFDDQLDQLLEIILKDKDNHRIREMGIKHIPHMKHPKIHHNKEQIMNLHQVMYDTLQDFVNKGKIESKIKQELPNDMVLGFIFGTIDLPNRTNMPYDEWFGYIRDVIRHGIVTIK